MTFRRVILILSIATLLVGLTVSTSAQASSVIGQITGALDEAFAGGMSADGRFVVFESRGDIATENPRNADKNLEIFLFDYAQRRIFQLTDTKSVLYNTSAAGTFDNIRISILNTRPVISNDGKWIAFSSNATIAFPGDGPSNPPVISSTNPGSFDGNAYTSPTPTPSPSPAATPTPGANPLTKDANLEVWLYQVPTVAPVASLSTGDEVAFAELAGGTFTRVTNSIPSQLPRGGTASTGAFVADDNHDPSISADGGMVAFVSTRDLVPAVGNSFPANEDNDEIFTYARVAATLNQVTKTPRGLISNPIYNKNPTISGDGLRVCFASTGDDPIDDPASTTNFDTGSNPVTSRNEEIFFANLTGAGVPSGGKQVTTTTPTNAGDPVNILDLGRRMSKDGKLIVFDSYADLATPAENSGTNYTSFATYVYDVTANTTRRILPRSDADSAASGGDVHRYASFTDNDGSGAPSTLILASRVNIKADGTIPATASDGLNPSSDRPAQLYTFPITVPTATATFTRLASFPTPSFFIASTQALTSDSSKRFAFNLALSELGGGNFDLTSKVYYMLTPTVVNQAAVTATYATGASRQAVSQTVVPTPTPTASPTATPTPSPSPSPTATPTPTPVTPAAVFGLAPGMAASVAYQAGFDRPIVTRTGVGSLRRSFTLPIELSGLTMTINGYACGLKYVSRHRIDFVVPLAVPASDPAGTKYPLVINNNGTLLKTEITLVPSRPDIFRADGLEAGGGRVKAFNVTNRVFRTEPFTVRTVRTRPVGRVPTTLRLYLTGVQNATLATISVRASNSATSALTVLALPVLVEPGVYTLDVALRDELNGAGDVPVVVTVTIGSSTFSSRLDDTAPRIQIL